MVEAFAATPQIISMDPDRVRPLIEQINDHRQAGIAFLTNTSGRMILRSDGQDADIDYSDRDYFKTVIKTGKPAYSKRLRSRSLGHDVIVIAVPVKNHAGQVIGVLAANKNAQKISGVLATTIDETPDSYAFVVDRSGCLITHPAPSVIDTITTARSLAPVAEVMKGQSGYGEYTYNGVRKLAGFASLTNSGYGVIYQQPADIALAEINRVRHNQIIISLLTSFAALLAVAFLHTRLTRVTEIISATVSQLANRRLDARMPYLGNNELGAIADCINDMAHELQIYERNLADTRREASEQRDIMMALYKATEEIAEIKQDDQQTLIIAGSSLCKIMGTRDIQITLGTTVYSTGQLLQDVEIEGAPGQSIDLDGLHGELLFKSANEGEDASVTICAFSTTPFSSGNEMALGLYCEMLGIAYKNKLLYKKANDEIVGRAEAQEALFQSICFQTSLINAVPVPLFYKDMEGKYLGFNTAFETAFGVDRNRLAGKTVYELMPPDQAAKMSDRDQEAICLKRHTFDEEEIVLGSGEVVHMMCHRAPYYVYGEPRGTIGTMLDITDLKNTQQALEESQQQLTAILDYLPDPTIVINTAGRVIVWNRAISTMTGISPNEMLGRGEYEYSIPFTGRRKPILIDYVLHPDLPITANYTVISRGSNTLVAETPMTVNNTLRYFWGVATTIRDQTGAVLGAIETIKDITDRVQAQQQIVEAKEEADRANRSKSVFLSNMSHELRTPLNAIMGYTQILQRTTRNSEQSRQLATIMSSGRHLLELINDVLDISAIEADKITLHPINFDLPASINQSCMMTTHLCSDQKLKFVHREDTALPSHVWGDERKIRQILINLLTNAIKYTPQGGTITLATAYQDGRLICRISDTGHGIHEDQHETIFQPFTQLQTTRRVKEGVGLGLSISRRLARLMGGDVAVESVPGQGSCFTLDIPLTQTLPFSPPLINQIQQARESINILVADDNQTNARMLAEFLTLSGFAVHTATSGPQVLESLNNDPDLVILDLVMPDMDGNEIAATIRERGAKTKIIGASSTPVEDSAMDRFRLLCDDYIVKPALLDELLDKIIHLMGLKSDSAAAIITDDTETVGSCQFPPFDEGLYGIAMKGALRRVGEIAQARATGEYRDFYNRLSTLAQKYKGKEVIAWLMRCETNNGKKH